MTVLKNRVLASGAAAAVMVFAVQITQATGVEAFTPIDIMEAVRASTVENKFTISTTGEAVGSHSEQLFDGDLTADSGKAEDQNGRALFTIKNGPSITVSFNPAVFGNRQVFLRQYGFRMWHKGLKTSWAVASRMPGTWTVHVSGAETPTSETDWRLVDDSRERPIAYSNVGGEYYSADFTTDEVALARHVRFTFTSPNVANDYLSLGEITMSGLIAPDDADARYVCFYGTGIKSVNDDGSVDAKVSILPAGQTVDPYDLFVECRTGDHADTNWLARATTLTGPYETKVTGLRLGADYTLRFGAVAANGAVSAGDAVKFTSIDDSSPSRLPTRYTELEYIESTDGGNQCIDCGFSPQSAGGNFGFDLDFVGYNAFLKNTEYDKGTRDNSYGVYLSSSTALFLSTSTGSAGTYKAGMFYWNGAKGANLVRNERMRYLVGGGTYSTIVGSTTNSWSFPRHTVSGPNLFLAACYTAPATTNQFAVMRIYSLKTYDESVSADEPAHEFVPAKRRSDNAIGVYDVVAARWCPNGSATPFLAGPAVVGEDSLSIDSVSFAGRTLTVTLSRSGTSTAETEVFAAWGADYAAMDTESWAHKVRLGAFAENALTAQFTTPALARDTVYVRFYTGDGKWSETVYLPDLDAKAAGLVILVR